MSQHVYTRESSHLQEGERSETHDIMFDQNVIILDVETTGMCPKKDRIIQLSLIKLTKEGQVTPKNYFFNPSICREQQIEAFKVHKISPDFLLTKKVFQQHAQEIIDLFSDVTFIVGHNILFDWNFLYFEYKRLEEKTAAVWLDKLESKCLVDTYKLSIAAFPNIGRYRLQDVAAHLKLEVTKQPIVKYEVSSPSKKEVVKVKMIPEDGFHDAVTDTIVTKEVFIECLKNLQGAYQHENGTELLRLTDLKEKLEYVYWAEDLVTLDGMSDEDCKTCANERMVTMAHQSMSTLRDSRGKSLKDVVTLILQDEIAFLARKADMNNRRGELWRKITIAQRALSRSPEKKSLLKITPSKKREVDEKLTSYYQQKKPKISFDKFE